MIRNWLSRLIRDVRGNVMVISAVGAASLVGAAGLGVDTVQWYLWKRQLQQAVDSGALAAALTQNNGGDWAAAAGDEADRNFADTFTIVRTVNPPQEGDFTGDTGAIEMVATTSRSLPFSSLFLSTAPTIRVRSVATTVMGARHCMISLAEDGTGITVTGSAEVELGCGTAANARGADAVKLSGSSKLLSNPISAVGGIDYAKKNVGPNTTMLPYGLPVEDPLADRGLTTPSGPCLQNNFSVGPKQTFDPLPPGRYCGGLSIRGTVTLETGGVYVIDQGTFQINSGAKLVGEGVTIILTGDDPSNVADLAWNGSADIQLRAPTDDENPDWSGIVLYQDAMGSDRESTINGGANLSFDGIVYMPRGDIKLNGNSGQTAKCLLLVANRVKFAGTSKIGNDCEDDIDDLATRARIVRVVE